MRRKGYLFFRNICLAIAGLLLLTFGEVVGKTKRLHAADGPYLLYPPIGEMRMITVGLKGELKDTTYAVLPSDFTFPVVSHEGRHRFEVTLHTFRRPAWRVAQAGRMLVLSDPHGNLDCLVSVLKNNGVIGEHYEWTFGRGQLVVIGDVFDRGNDVVPIFWLLYKLEAEAARQGGAVIFTLGNHEEMVLRGDVRYMKEKYKHLADTLGMSYPALWDENTELGRWLRTRNLITVVGDNLIVHAGLSSDFSNWKKAVPALNEVVGRTLSLGRQERQDYSAAAAFVYDTKMGPFWYHGMVKSADHYRPLDARDLTRLLRQLKVKRILLGHTIFDDITTFYQQRVIAVNVDNRENRKKERGRGILLENGQVFVIYDTKFPRLFIR